MSTFQTYCPHIRKRYPVYLSFIFDVHFLGWVHFYCLLLGRQFTPEVVEAIFFWILEEINNAGYLSPEAVFVDGTHIKANANTKKIVKKAVPKAAKVYEEQLMNEINEEREKNGKKPFDEPKSPQEKEIKESTTDPESGVFHKGEHKKCFAYTALPPPKMAERNLSDSKTPIFRYNTNNKSYVLRDRVRKA